MVLIPYLQEETIRMLEVSIKEDNILKLNKVNETGTLFRKCRRIGKKDIFYSLFSLNIELTMASDDPVLHQEYVDFFRQLQFKLLDSEISIKTLNELNFSTYKLNINEFRYIRKVIEISLQNTEILDKILKSGVINILENKQYMKGMKNDGSNL